jgi:hypothetical protein
MGTSHGALLQLAKEAAATIRLSKEHLKHDLRKRRPASRNHRCPSGASHSWIFVPHGAMINAATFKLRRCPGPRQLVVGRIESNSLPVSRYADFGSRACIRNENAINKITAKVHRLSGNERGARAYTREKETDAGKNLA